VLIFIAGFIAGIAAAEMYRANKVYNEIVGRVLP